MKQTSPQTKSFIIFFAVAAIGTYLCLMLWVNLKSNTFSNTRQTGSYQAISYPDQVKADNTPVVTPPVDTSSWQTYTNAKYGLSFKYKPGWKVSAAANKKGFTIIGVDPGKKYYNFEIYISPTAFFAMDNLPTKTETIGGQEAINVNDSLYGIKANNLYYTFDIGSSEILKADFNGLVHSLSFTK